MMLIISQDNYIKLSTGGCQFVAFMSKLVKLFMSQRLTFIKPRRVKTNYHSRERRGRGCCLEETIRRRGGMVSGFCRSTAPDAERVLSLDSTSVFPRDKGEGDPPPYQ